MYNMKTDQAAATNKNLGHSISFLFLSAETFFVLFLFFLLLALVLILSNFIPIHFAFLFRARVKFKENIS